MAETSRTVGAAGPGQGGADIEAGLVGEPDIKEHGVGREALGGRPGRGPGAGLTDHPVAAALEYRAGERTKSSVVVDDEDTARRRWRGDRGSSAAAMASVPTRPLWRTARRCAIARLRDWRCTGSPEPGDDGDVTVDEARRDVRRALRRLAIAVALLVALPTAAPAWAQDQPAGTGHKDAGESASAWHGVVAFVGGIVLALVVCGLLVWIVLGRRRADATPPSDRPDPAASGTPSPPPPPVDGRTEAGAQELAVLTFDHVEGAERAYADTRGRANDAAWVREVAFVECHRRGRIIVRGTFAGHYLDVDDVADVIGHDTAVGAVAGAVVGLAFGPPGLAVGLVGGGIAGGVRESSTHTPEERGALFDEIRRDIPERSSGLVALVSAGDAEALIAALHHRAVRVTRHRLSAAESDVLSAAVAQAPSAATPDR